MKSTGEQGIPADPADACRNPIILSSAFAASPPGA